MCNNIFMILIFAISLYLADSSLPKIGENEENIGGELLDHLDIISNSPEKPFLRAFNSFHHSACIDNQVRLVIKIEGYVRNTDQEVNTDKNNKVTSISLYNENQKINLLQLFSQGSKDGSGITAVCVIPSVYELKLESLDSDYTKLGDLFFQIGNSKGIKIDLDEIQLNEVVKVFFSRNGVKLVDTDVIRHLLAVQWQYRNDLPVLTSWKEDYDENDNEWIKSDSFLDFTSQIRYYRNVFTITDINNSGPPKLTITYKDGIIIYINGNEIFKRNFNGNAIVPFAAATEEIIWIPLPSLRNGENVIAIEIHKLDSVGSDPLSVTLEEMAKITSSQIITTTATVDTSDVKGYTSSGYEGEVRNVDKVFTLGAAGDYSAITLQDNAHPKNKAFWLPFSIVYKFKGYNAFYFNEFKISGCSNNGDTSPKNIKIYGATDKDHPIWEEIYSNTNLGLQLTIGCSEIKTFSLKNVKKAYESYKFSVIDNVAYNNGWGHYIQYRLFTLQKNTIPICSASKGYDSVYVGGKSYLTCPDGGYKTRMCNINGEWDIEVNHGCIASTKLNSKPGVEASITLDKAIKSTTEGIDGLTFSGNNLIVNSEEEYVYNVQVIFTDNTFIFIYVSVLRDEVKCSYGFESINLLEIEYDLKLKCNIQPIVLNIVNLPFGILYDANTGRITGRATDITKEKTTTVLLHSDRQFNITFEWKKGGGSFTEGLEFIIWKTEKEDGIDADAKFMNKKLKDMWLGYENGYYSVKDPIIITNTEVTYSNSSNLCTTNYWIPCQFTVARIRGYLYIAEEGDYVLSGVSDDSQKFAYGNYGVERYTTTAYNDEKTFVIHLAKGYHVIGYLSWGGGGQNDFKAYYTTPSGIRTNINNIMYNGGFLLTHLSYAINTITYNEGVSKTVTASYEGYPSKWSMNPSIVGLSIRLDGALIGFPTVCDNQFKSVEISSNGGIDVSKTNVQIICYSDSDKANKINGLLVKYYTASKVDVNIFEEPASAVDSRLMLKRVEDSSIFHPQSEDLWNGLPSTMSHLFIADYRGYLNIESGGSYKMRLKCYDYCRLELGSVIFEAVGNGLHEVDKTIELTNQLYKLRIVYTKDGYDNMKELELLYDNSNSGLYTLIPNEWLFTDQPYPFIYSSIYNNYYVNDVISYGIINNNVNLEGFKYSIEPSLPIGLSFSNETGEVSGTVSVIEKERIYIITAEKDGIKYFSEFIFEVKPLTEPVIEYPNGGIVASINENFELIPTNLVCHTVSLISPIDFIFIDSNGVLTGKAIGSYSGVIKVECLTYRTVSVDINVNIAGCNEGNDFLIMDYLIKSQPESVVFEILNGETSIYLSSSEGSLVSNRVYTFMKCIPKVNAQLKIISNSKLGGWYKLSYENRNIFKYSSFFKDETVVIDMIHLSNKPILSYESASFELNNEIYYEFYPSIENGGKVFVVTNEENLPKGMNFDKESGLIYGTPTEKSESKSIIITVKNMPNGETSDEITLTFSSNVCKKVFFEVALYIKSGDQGFITYKMMNGEKEIQLFDKVVGESKKYFCEDPTSYELTLGSTNNQTWEYSEMRLQLLHNGAVLFRGRHFVNSTESKVKVNTKNLIPFNNQIKYTEDIQDNNDWSGLLFDSSNWISVDALPSFNDDKLVRYYIQSFEFTEDTIDLSMFYLSFTFSNGGVRMLMNGVEFYNKYLPKDATSETWGGSYEKSERKYFVTASVTLIQKGRNILGIEFHKSDISSTEVDEFKINEFYLLSGINSCYFDKYTYYSDDNVYSDKSNYNGNELTKYAFNYEVGKKGTWNSASIPLYFQYTFYPEESRWFNGLQYRTGSNTNRLVNNFTLLGIKTYPNSAESDYIPLYNYPQPNNTLVAGYHSKYFSQQSDNDMAFNGIRIQVNEGSGDGVDTGGVYPYSCRLSCFAEGEWKSIPLGETSKISCGGESNAFITRRCGEKGEWEEIDDSACRITTIPPSTPNPTTQTPTSIPPTTIPPTTPNPTTQTPTNPNPTTQTPTNPNPTTQTPTSISPTTIPPTNPNPTTQTPTSIPPTTPKPTTIVPTTAIPTTEKPTTIPPTTIPPSNPPTTLTPTTIPPSTPNPTTQTPTNPNPTTQTPTSISPTTEKPTSNPPTTLTPTTPNPTTAIPTTESPTVIPTTESPTETNNPTTSTKNDDDTNDTGTIESTNETLDPTTSIPTTIIPTTPKPIERISIEIRISNITSKTIYELSENDINILKDSIIEIYKNDNITLKRDVIEVILNNRRLLLRGLENEMNIEIIITIPEESTKVKILDVANRLLEDSSLLSEEIKTLADSSEEETIFKDCEVEITNVEDKTIYPTNPNNRGKGESNSSLSTGALIGIIVAAVVVVIIIVVGLMLCRSRKTVTHPKTKSKPNNKFKKPVPNKGIKPNGDNKQAGSNIEIPTIVVDEKKGEEKKEEEDEKSDEEEESDVEEVVELKETEKEIIKEEVANSNKEDEKEKPKSENIENKEEVKKEEETIQQKDEEEKEVPKDEVKREGVTPQPIKFKSKSSRKRSGSGLSYSSSYSSSSGSSDSETETETETESAIPERKEEAKPNSTPNAIERKESKSETSSSDESSSGEE